MNNRLALRIAIFGGFAVALFAILFFRLWLLQVIDGEKYLAEAKNNRTRDYRVSAPRGEILDRNGKVLVDQPHQPGAPGQPAQTARRSGQAPGRAGPACRTDPQHPDVACAAPCTKSWSSRPRLR